MVTTNNKYAAIQLAKQLRKPLDSKGVQIANGMNKANKMANRKVIQQMNFSDNDHVLELGPGNGVFVGEICKQAMNISYTGVDWSQTMIEEAKLVNSKSMKNHSIRFLYGNSKKLDFMSDSFNHVLTIHTIYFWKNPAQHFAEIHRVLKSNGHFYLAFESKFCK